MDRENKEILLKDLSARLPYGVKILYEGWDSDHGCEYTTIEELVGINDRFVYTLWRGERDKHSIQEPLSITRYKPFLRPMSSMTEEEKEELKSKCIHTETEEDWEGVRCDVWGIQILDKYDTERWDNSIWPLTINMDAIDWLNKNMFDYRGLIPKGLAIAVTEQNNPYKD